MTVLIKHNPVVEQNLKALLVGGKFMELRHYLEGLNNTAFRTAGYLLSHVLLPPVSPGTYWQAFLALVPSQPKAYLGTFLNAAVQQQAEGRFQLLPKYLEQYAPTASPVDRRKILEALLPGATSLADVRLLLNTFCEDSTKARTAFLLLSDTPACAFELFQQMKRLEGQPVEIRRTCLHLMRKATKHAFNLAAMLRAYFDLEDLPGNFSLRLEDYQLSRLDVSYEAFCKILNH